jgi:ketosteroid isomerase-like protein
MLEENIMTVRQAIEISNTGDTSRVDQVISPNYFDHESQADPVRSKLRGPEAFIDTVKMLRSAFADLHYEDQEVFSAPDKVAMVTRVTGEHTGNFSSFPRAEIKSIIKLYTYSKLVTMARSSNTKQFVTIFA